MSAFHMQIEQDGPLLRMTAISETHNLACTGQQLAPLKTQKLASLTCKLGVKLIESLD